MCVLRGIEDYLMKTQNFMTRWDPNGLLVDALISSQERWREALRLDWEPSHELSLFSCFIVQCFLLQILPMAKTKQKTPLACHIWHTEELMQTRTPGIHSMALPCLPDSSQPARNTSSLQWKARCPIGTAVSVAVVCGNLVAKCNQRWAKPCTSEPARGSLK